MTLASIFVTPALGGGPESAAPPTLPETPPSPRSVLRGQPRCTTWCCGRLGALFSDVFLLCDVNSSKSSGCVLQAPKGGGW